MYFWISLLFWCSHGYVEYASVDDAKAVADKREEFVLDGRSLLIGYSLRKTLQGT